MFVFQRPEDWLSTDMIVNKVKSLPDSFAFKNYSYGNKRRKTKEVCDRI